MKSNTLAITWLNFSDLKEMRAQANREAEEEEESADVSSKSTYLSLILQLIR